VITDGLIQVKICSGAIAMGEGDVVRKMRIEPAQCRCILGLRFEDDCS